MPWWIFMKKLLYLIHRLPPFFMCFKGHMTLEKKIQSVTCKLKICSRRGSHYIASGEWGVKRLAWPRLDLTVVDERYNQGYKKEGSIKNKPYIIIHTSTTIDWIASLWGMDRKSSNIRNCFNFIIILSGQIPIATSISKDYDVREFRNSCKQEQAKVNI